jgi:ribosomal protein L3 glutamine methyltransferase
VKKIHIEEAVNELRTLRDMIRWGVSQFNAADIYFGHGLDSAWDEAVFLALHAVHLPPNTDNKVLDARLTTQERRAVAELIARRVDERKPAAYLTQTAWFAGLPFYVDERVIIPRSPMAELIERGFDPWLERGELRRVLDLCTGCGCIAVACALAFPETKIDAVDISKEALEVAKINVERHGVEEQIRLIQTDLFSGLEFNSYDLIISNPPYVSLDEMRKLPQEYRHEPELALSGGEEGLDVIEKILSEAPNYLTSHGLLIAEVGSSAAALEQKFPELPFLWLEFERGGHGVFLITAEQLREYF